MTNFNPAVLNNFRNPGVDPTPPGAQAGSTSPSSRTTAANGTGTIERWLGGVLNQIATTSTTILGNPLVSLQAPIPIGSSSAFPQAASSPAGAPSSGGAGNGGSKIEVVDQRQVAFQKLKEKYGVDELKKLGIATADKLPEKYAQDIADGTPLEAVHDSLKKRNVEATKSSPDTQKSIASTESDKQQPADPRIPSRTEAIA